MMQISSDSATNKHSLINVMHRFIAAANNMDETIMVPSLLRDMPLEDQAGGQTEANNNIIINHHHHHRQNDDDDDTQCPSKQQRDMYEHYLLLKSIKNDMEWGPLKRDVSSSNFLDMAVKKEQKSISGALPMEDNADLERQFHFHLRGLFGVLSKLTLEADHLTNRYKREIGGGNFIR
ncbi:mid1-interacting protein 1-like [Stigmatopora nigra]